MAFVYDAETLAAGKSDLAPSTVPADKKVTASEYNALIAAVTDLRTALLSGQYHGLAVSTAAVAPSGQARLRVAGGGLEASVSGQAYSQILTAAAHLPSEHVNINEVAITAGDVGAVVDNTDTYLWVTLGGVGQTLDESSLGSPPNHTVCTIFNGDATASLTITGSGVPGGTAGVVIRGGGPLVLTPYASIRLLAEAGTGRWFEIGRVT